MTKQIILKMKCEECSHIQEVKSACFEEDHRNRDGELIGYFGSAYDFCDECDGLPILLERMIVEK